MYFLPKRIKLKQKEENTLISRNSQIVSTYKMTSKQEQHSLHNSLENTSEKKAQNSIKNQGCTDDKTNESAEGGSLMIPLR